MSWTELIFIIMSNMELCFRFVLNTRWIIQRCICYCSAGLTQNQSLFCFSYCQAGKAGGGAWEETQPGQTTQTTPEKGYFRPFHIMLNIWGGGGGGKKEGGRRRKSGTHLDWWCLSSQATVKCDGALLFWRCLNTCLPMGIGELIPYFSFHVHAATPFPIKWSSYQSTNFLPFALTVLSPVPTVAEWDGDCMVLVGFSHKSIQTFQTS